MKLLLLIILVNCIYINAQFVPTITPDPYCASYMNKTACLKSCNCYWCDTDLGCLCYSYLDTTPDLCTIEGAKIEKCNISLLGWIIAYVIIVLGGCCFCLCISALCFRICICCYDMCCAKSEYSEITTPLKETNRTSCYNFSLLCSCNCSCKNCCLLLGLLFGRKMNNLDDDKKNNIETEKYQRAL
jgi:hypothetical protein